MDTPERHAKFGVIEVAFDGRVLEPRPWTVAQSEWVAELSGDAPDGAILELCAGAGQIGLLAAVLTGRSLVQVERDSDAASYARRNAIAMGLATRVTVLVAGLEDALDSEARFPLVVADPPYVPSVDVGRFPADPRTAIDGGPDGLAVVRACLGVIDQHLAVGGAAVVQLRGPAQVDEVAALTAGLGVRVHDSRVVDAERALALLGR